MRALIATTDDTTILCEINCVNYFHRTGRMVLYLTKGEYPQSPQRYSTPIPYERYEGLLEPLLLDGYVDWSEEDFQFTLLE